MARHLPDLHPAIQRHTGFDLARSGVHNARTIMAEELGLLLRAVPATTATLDDFKQAVLVDNCLGRKTYASRAGTLRHLKALYSLDYSFPLFRGLRYFWVRANGNQSLVLLLCALTRDVFLRQVLPTVLETPIGELHPRERTEQAIVERCTGTLSVITLNSTAKNINSSFTQAGHFRGRSRKVRAKVSPTPATTACAVYLAYLAGCRGLGLLDNIFVSAFDAVPSELSSCLEQAARRGYMSMSRLGDVLEVSFPELLTQAEVERIRGQN